MWCTAWRAVLCFENLSAAHASTVLPYKQVVFLLESKNAGPPFGSPAHASFIRSGSSGRHHFHDDIHIYFVPIIWKQRPSSFSR